MHIRFKHKGVAAPPQRFAVLFFDQNMAGLNDPLIDLIQKFRGEQADVVLERLVGGADSVKGAMAKQGAW